MRRRFSRAPFRRRFHRRRVSWLTDSNQVTGYNADQGIPGDELGNLQVWPLTHVDNDFVENHPKFAKRNDVTSYRRILGSIRWGLYTTDQSALKQAYDYTISYGLALVKGEYDNSGTFSPPNDSFPDPRETSDEDDKWLYKNRAILSFGLEQYRRFDLDAGTEVYPLDASITDVGPVVRTTTDLGTVSRDREVIYRQATRPCMISTDQQLPNGSHIDIKTRRKSQFAEKLYLIAVAESNASDWATTLISLDYQLRVLVNG